ncbi:MAG: RluA family pseudouridine synthase [candidate division WOR-3 bacterium]
MNFGHFINSLFSYKKYDVPDKLNSRRIDYVLGVIAEISRKEARSLIEWGFVLLNGSQITFPSKRVRTRDSIILIDRTEYLKQLSYIEIVYEDRNLIVVNKPPFILTNKESSESGRSIEERLSENGKIVYPVHRLDRETSGVVIFAKDGISKKYLIEQFKRQVIKKKYIGIVNGVIEKKSEILRGKLGKKEYAATRYRVVEKFKDATLLEFFPITGRTHQIRIQMAQLGYPIVGDKKYWKSLERQIFFPRQMLHSSEIGLLHPETKKWIEFSVPIPDDMNKLIAYLKV